MDEFAQRLKRAADNILENERLTSELDDAAAQVLLDWGVACAEEIARSTAGLKGSKVEEAMSPRLRATRRLMRRVSKWVANRRTMDGERSGELLSQISEQAEIIYGEGFAAPDTDQRDILLRLPFVYADEPQQMIADLRQTLDVSSKTAAADFDALRTADDETSEPSRSAELPDASPHGRCGDPRQLERDPLNIGEDDEQADQKDRGFRYW